MSLGQNKKGLEFATLIEIILVLIGTGLLIGVFLIASARADEKTAENLCRGFNALRFGTEYEVKPLGVPIYKFKFAPKACKTIDKKDLPSSDYKNHINGLKEGTKTEIRNLMARCWWMWLEGHQQNMFEKGFYNIQNGCFVCYTFSIDKNVQGFGYNELAASLNAPYYAVDSTDRCASSGQGGKCMQSCDKNSDYFSREVPSNRCAQGLKCCVATDSQDECKNKEGRCLSEPTTEYNQLYTKWQCKTGSCFIKKDKIASYLDYIQGTAGVSGGAGKVLFGDNEGFKPGLKYAITFISPGNEWDAGTLLGLVTTGGGLYVIGATLVGGAFPPLILVGSAAVSALMTSNTGTRNDINYITISKYDTVADKCAIESGVGEN